MEQKVHTHLYQMMAFVENHIKREKGNRTVWKCSNRNRKGLL